MIVVSDLTLSGRLAPIAFEIEPGMRWALVGPNGGGKTSLLRALAGLEYDRGEVTIGGKSLFDAPPAMRRKMIGFLPASRDLHWPIAVRDLIGLGFAMRDDAAIDALIGAFELEGLAERPSNGLSTGERARVLLARVLAEKPPLLLLDEPLSNLDPYWVLRFLHRVDEEAARGAAVLVALHDLSQLHRFDRALLIDGGQVVANETPDGLLAHPAFEKSFRVVKDGPGFALKP